LWLFCGSLRIALLAVGESLVPASSCGLSAHNRLFICASTSLYVVDVNMRGVEL